MINFENQVCDVCGKSFDKDSDIVVCPDCGTPHHRECWMELGHCVNRDKHGEGFEWKPIMKAPEIPAGGELNELKCSNCGSVNPKGTLFCENCGTALKQPFNPNNMAGGKNYNMPGGGRIQVHQVPMGGINQEDFNRRVEQQFYGELDGIPMKEVAAFIGPNAQYYTFKFRKMDANPKYKPFNWSACLFTPLWFLFRKMWSMAIISGVINFILGRPTLIITAVQAGQLSPTSPLMFPGIETVAGALALLSIVISVIFGFMAIPMYRKDTVKRLRKIKEESKGDDRLYYTTLMHQSGPSKIGMVVVVFYAAYMMFSMFMPY